MDELNPIDFLPGKAGVVGGVFEGDEVREEDREWVGEGEGEASVVELTMQSPKLSLSLKGILYLCNINVWTSRIVVDGWKG
jgi:hypothetical protein